MDEAKQDTDKIQKGAEVIAKALILGKKVYADKAINLEDLKHAPEAIDLVKSAIEVGVAYKEIGEEAGDLDPGEIIALVTKGIELVKQVEQA